MLHLRFFLQTLEQNDVFKNIDVGGTSVGSLSSTISRSFSIFNIIIIIRHVHDK